MTDILLHGFWRSSAAYRVRIALGLKGLAYRQQSIANWPKQSLQTQYQTFIDDWRHCAQAVRLPLTIYPVLSTT